MESKQRYTFKKDERLKSRKQIEHLFNDGQRFSVSLFRIFYSLQNNPASINQSLQAGFGASSRNFKTAVDRNRIKRLIKEAWRLQKNSLHDHLHEEKKKLSVFILYMGKDIPEYELVFEKIGIIINRLIKFTDAKS